MEDSSTVAISRSPFTRSVEPVDTRSTITSAMPMCGAISAAPDTGTTSTRLAALAEEALGDAREDRGDACAGARCRRAVAMPLSSRAATASRQRPNSRSASSSSVRPGLADEVEARDAGVGGAVGDELGNVLRADEQRLELAAERRGEGARAGGADLESGVGEELAGFLGETALVGKCDAKHEVGP